MDQATAPRWTRACWQPQALPDAATWGAPPPQRYLLLLSHLHGHADLLAELLGSSPEIQGPGAPRLRCGPPRARRAPARSRWLLDTVLHNDIDPLAQWVAPEQIDLLIFLRRPEAALHDMLALAAAQGPRALFKDAQACCEHYVQRLHGLCAEAEHHAGQALYFDAELLREQPQWLASQIGAWLGLRSALQAGGPAPGAAVTQPAQTLPRAVLADAEAAYQQCRQVLRQSCTLVRPARQAS